MKKKLLKIVAGIVCVCTIVLPMQYAKAAEKQNSTDTESVEEDTTGEAAITDTKKREHHRYLQSGTMTIVLDPGHDDVHTGANYNGLAEADLNLKIAQYCKAALEQFSGVNVFMTRTSSSCPHWGTDAAQDLHERTAYAASVGANLFVSIHCNASQNPAENGATVFYPNGSYNAGISATGKGVSDSILNSLTALGLGSHGTIARNSESGSTYPDGSLADYYSVIRTSKLRGFPGIIVEHAYVSNSGDANQYLNSDSKLKALGEADAAGIARYFGLVSENGLIFDAKYYYDNYPDLQQAIGYNPEALLRHFNTFGMTEGRQGCATFNVHSYRNRYVDLRNVFGNDLKKYYQHYLLAGYGEGRVGTGYENQLVGEPVAPHGDVYMFRMYNPNSGEHFYTASSGEKYNLITYGWVYEGIGWTAPANGNPVYRLYNPNAGDHHYTLSSSERDMLVRAGWVYENVAFNSDVDHSVPLYRQYNPNTSTGAHNFTTSVGENNNLLNHGWFGEGISWYGVNE